MKVVVPKARQVDRVVTLASREERMFAGPWSFVDTTKANADHFIDGLCELLTSKGLAIGRRVRKPAPEAELSEEQLKELRDASTVVVECFGDCGASLSRAVLDASRLEAMGVPTAVVTSAELAASGRLIAGGLGAPRLALVPLSYHFASLSAVGAAELGKEAYPEIEGHLSKAPKPEAGLTDARNWAEPTCSLSDDPVEAAREMDELGWTDGLPGVPPEAASVRRVLEMAQLTPDVLMPAVPPLGAPETAERWAANAVLAGARPEYFNAIVAAVEAVLDPAAGLMDSQNATNPSAPVVFFNGPVVERLGLRSAGNCFGSGFSANAVIGRAVRLILHNLGGEDARVNDLSTHGQPGKFTFCFAEREDASPWAPWHVEKGFRADDSVVTVVMGNAPQNIFAYGCTTADELLGYVVSNLVAPGHMNTMFATGPLLVLGPDHARLLARDGMDRRAVQEALFHRARFPIANLPPNARTALRSRRANWFDVAGDAENIGVADDPDDVHIVVAGGPGIHSCFVSTSFSKKPVTRLVR